MRQDEKEKKKFYFRIPFKPDSGKKIPKKIAKKLEKLKKPLSDINFSQNGMRQIDREREKKKFTPEFRSYSTQTRKFQKNCKKIEKIKKPLSDIIFSHNGMRQAEKGGKNFYSGMQFILDPAKKILKKIAKKFKKFKNHFPTLFLAKTG